MKKSVIVIMLSAALLVSATSCWREPEETSGETLPRITGTTTMVTETSVPEQTFPYYNINDMYIEEIENALLEAAGSGEPIIEYTYDFEENHAIGLLDGRTYSYHIMDENPDVFGGFSIYLFDPNSETFQNLQVGDSIAITYGFDEEVIVGDQVVTAVNGDYVFSAWETPRGGGYNSTAPFACEEIENAYELFVSMDS